MKGYQLIGLCIILLTISMPLAFADRMTGWSRLDFQGPPNASTGGATTSNTTSSGSGPAPSLSATIPAKVGDHRVDINVTGTNGSRLEIYVNDEKVRTVFTFDGSMTLRNIPLPRVANTLKIIATLNGQSTETSGSIEVDTRAPNVQLTIPVTSKLSPLVLNGSTNKPVTIRYRVTQGDQTAPDPVVGVTAITTANAGEVTWRSSAEPDVVGYLIYRDNTLVGTVSARNGTLTQQFRDSGIAQGQTYIYQVSALDNGCNEGPRSVNTELQVTTGPASPSNSGTPDIRQFGCEYQTTNVQGNFTVSLPVKNGVKNKVELIATDDVGNKAEFSEIVTIDTVAPKFLSNNLDRLSPTYDPFITVRGNLDEQARVTILVNGRPEKSTNTDENGHFSADITLPRNVNLTITERTTGFESGQGWTSQIGIVATDAAGNTATVQNTPITYALCGEGNLYSVHIGEALPSSLNPRLMLEGLQQLGFSFNATYAGSYNATIQSININPVQMSPDEREKFDNDRVTVTPVYQVGRDQSIAGYAQINFRPFDPLPDQEDATTFDKEEAISNQHKDDCKVPGLGCVRLRMIMEIKFQESVPAPTFADPNRRTTDATSTLQNQVQKTCVDFEVSIDERIPPSAIPKNLLTTLSEGIGRIVDVMDRILKPLTTLGTYLIYACFASNAALFLLVLNEKWSCEFSSTASAVSGSGKWDKEVAQVGLCEAVYAGTDQETQQKRDNCKSCESAIENAKDFEEEVMRLVCDRVACPSAPTWQTHNKNARASVTDITSKVQSALGNNDVSKWADQNNKIWAGNDCAVKREGSTVVYGRANEKYDSLKPAYQLYTGTGTTGASSKITKEDCENTLRPASPLCCGIEYMEQWGSACGVSSGSLDTFDEIKESMCLAAEKEGRKDVEGENCGGLWNAAAGFCEPGTGNRLPELVRTGVVYEQPQANADGNTPYLIIVEQRNAAGNEATGYKVYIGYPAKRHSFNTASGNRSVNRVASPTGAGNVLGQNQYINNTYLNANLDMVYRKDVTSIFFNGKQTRESVVANHNALKTEVCAEAGVGTGTAGSRCLNTLTTQRSKELYDQVLAKIQVPDQEYIVRPDEGILTSLRCLCIPALTSWIARWRQILGILKTCIDTIRTTGDGSAGACEAFISQYACDLLYEALTCFTSKFGSPGGGTTIANDLPFGNIFGAVTSAGTEMNRRITGRYGTTSLYRTLFNDRKLANAVCLFAFTGTWNLDFDALISQAAGSAPIPSQGMIGPCRRRFNGYDISTRPTGLVNWVYNFGVVLIPGTDIRYQLELQCSDGFTCDPNDGFKNGECDCNKVGKKTATINPEGFGTGTLKSSDEPLNVNLFFPLNARRPTAPANVRYDKAILKWQSNDPRIETPSLREGSAECTIDLEGSDAPAFCSWDLFTSSFRCQFGQQRSTIQLKKVTTKYTNVVRGSSGATNIDVFGLNETIKFDLDILQVYPPERDEQDAAIKYLGYEIKNQDQRTVHKTPSTGSPYTTDLQLKRDGDYTKSIEIPNIINRDAFKAPTQTTSGQLLWLPGSPTGSVRSTDTPLATNFRIVGGNATTLPPYILLAFTQQSFKVFESTGAQSGTDRRYQRGTELTAQTGGGDIVTDVGRARRFDRGTRYSVEFSLREKPTELNRLTQVDLLIPTGAVTSRRADPCNATNPTAVDWIATFNIYDADEFGKATNQISIDASTGQPATKTVTFRTICGTNVVARSNATSTTGTSQTAQAPTTTLQLLGETTYPMGSQFLAFRNDVFRARVLNPAGHEITIYYKNQQLNKSNAPIVTTPLQAVESSAGQLAVQYKPTSGTATNKTYQVGGLIGMVDERILQNGAQVSRRSEPGVGDVNIVQPNVPIVFQYSKSANNTWLPSNAVIELVSPTIRGQGTLPLEIPGSVSTNTNVLVRMKNASGSVIYVDQTPLRVGGGTSNTSVLADLTIPLAVSVLTDDVFSGTKVDLIPDGRSSNAIYKRNYNPLDELYIGWDARNILQITEIRDGVQVNQIRSSDSAFSTFAQPGGSGQARYPLYTNNQNFRHRELRMDVINPSGQTVETYYIIEGFTTPTVQVRSGGNLISPGANNVFTVGSGPTQIFLAWDPGFDLRQQGQNALYDASDSLTLDFQSLNSGNQVTFEIVEPRTRTVVNTIRYTITQQP